MKPRGRGDTFKDQDKLKEMLSLRAEGVGPSALAARYGVDHSTIIYHAKNHGVDAEIKRGLAVSSIGKIHMAEVPARVIIVKQIVSVRIDDDGSRINPGMDYKDYLEACEERRWRELLEGGKNRNK